MTGQTVKVAAKTVEVSREGVEVSCGRVGR